jgi:hypothetical protein
MCDSAYIEPIIIQCIVHGEECSSRRCSSSSGMGGRCRGEGVAATAAAPSAPLDWLFDGSIVLVTMGVSVHSLCSLLHILIGRA